MKNKMMWLLVVIVALWVVSLPMICKADDIRPWTKGEKATLVWSTAAVIADMFTTCRMLDNPDNYERNPFLGEHPSDGKVIVHLSLSHLACIGIAHFWPDLELPLIGKINTRYTLLGGKACLNTYYAINNSRLDW